MTQVIVTDHALVRYIERVYGLDLSKLRQEIGDKVRAGATVQAKSVIHDNIEFRLEPHAKINGAVAVITIMDLSMRDRVTRPKSLGNKVQERREHHKWRRRTR